MKLRIPWVLCLLCLIASASKLPAQDTATTMGPGQWDESIVRQFETLPIQDQGRVKPFKTFALYKLVEFSGRKSLRLPDGERLTATEWLLDNLFHPEIARHYPVILVENPAVMQAIGLTDARKRARFSFAEIEPHQMPLLEFARQFSQLDEKQRNTFQNQILSLFDVYSQQRDWLHAFDFARFHQPIVPDSPLAQALAPIIPAISERTEAINWTYSDILARMPQLVEAFQAEQTGHDHATELAEGPVLTMLRSLESAALHSTPLTMVPPARPAVEAEAARWWSPGTLLTEAAAQPEALEYEISMVAALEQLAAAHGDPVAFEEALGMLHRELRAGAARLAETTHLDLEAFYHRANFFRWALVLYILGFILVACTWLLPRNRLLYRLTAVTVTVPTILLMIGITLRCIIRDRPPVTTLYETTLFVPAVAIVIALIIEWINRKRVALSTAAILGMGGLFLANRFELRDGVDPMETMQAVLNSNFWLSTHVTTVTIGYSAGLLAAVIAHIYIVCRLLGLSRNPLFYRNIARMVYGVICFGTFFAFIGTVLGGIWANYSWGRFWGWDPKENGALLIILWFLFILHARLGGYLRDLGVCVAAVFGGIIVAFSWWGVNLLNVGLHSYGFISGVHFWLTSFYILELTVILLGLVIRPLERLRLKAGQRQSAPGLAAANPAAEGSTTAADH